MFSGFSACTMGDYVYLVGGSDHSIIYGCMCRRYHPTTDTWIPMPPIHRAFQSLQVNNNNNRLYALGVGPDYEFYDPNENRWTLGQLELEQKPLYMGAHFLSHVHKDQLVLEYLDRVTTFHAKYYQPVRTVFTFLSSGHLRFLTKSKLDRDINHDKKSLVHGDQRLIIKYLAAHPFDLFNLKTNRGVALSNHDIPPKIPLSAEIKCVCKVSSALPNQNQNQNQTPLQVMCLFNTGELYWIQFGLSATTTWKWTLLEPTLFPCETVLI
jgi:hypothetical protein